jgi:lysozyme
MKPKLKILLIIASGVLLLSGLSLYFGYVRFNYPSKARFPIRGIDISHHQGKIFWERLKKESIDFVIIKATEGGDYRDALFQKNLDSAGKYGYKVGVYHFYRFCTDYSRQVENFKIGIEYGRQDIPPTVDLEFGGNCKTDKSREQIISDVKMFLIEVEKIAKAKPNLYATFDFYDKYLRDDFREYPIWIRDLFHEPKLEGNRKWSIWQFANRGRLKGISGYVDMNTMTKEYWKIILSRHERR